MKHFLFIMSFVIWGVPIGVFGASILVAPETPVQGDPLMIQIDGVTGTTSVQQVLFGSTPLGVFAYAGRPTALYGIDLRKAPGIYRITARLGDGTRLGREVVIGSRERFEEVFSIPTKLGGNATTSQRALASRLATENVTLENISTGKKAFWSRAFQYPIALPVVTDTYGYVRKTGATSVAHKGTDFRAPIGTDVSAMNRGVVRLVRTYDDYGRTIVVDHGLGLMTFYMHLSKIFVQEGELVLPGQVIGQSGDTGYAEHPHLHISIRIGGVSIDPVKFMGLFK